MDHAKESLKPIPGANRSLRRRLTLSGELSLAFLPTVTVLAVLAFVGGLSEQRLLFASLASSAFLIYLDPEHGTNRVRTLALAQLAAAVLGWLGYAALGPGYLSAGSAMVATIVLMILADAVHPPAVGTAMAFALRAGTVSNLGLFGLAVGMTVVLVVLKRIALWTLARFTRAGAPGAAPGS